MMNATPDQTEKWNRFAGKHPELAKEFSERMARLKDEGLVDMKTFISHGAREQDHLSQDERDEKMAGMIAVYNNVLRLREEGKSRPLTLDVL